MKSKFLSYFGAARKLSFWMAIGLVLSLSLGWVTPFSTPAVAQEAIWAEITYLEQSDEHWMEVNLSDRHLTAWEGGVPVYSAYVATGTDDDPTYEGVFAVQQKYPVAAMKGKSADGTPYEIEDVPYVLYYDGSYAIHGAYWHDAFGEFITHGCVNVPVDQAEWLYNWAYIGSPVVVHW
jgi:lipoprotein-anchoring transpeptidase ErfK/SrfK